MQLSTYVGVPLEEVNFRVAGVNRVSFFIRFEWSGEDLYPLLWKVLENDEIRSRDREDLIERFAVPIDEHIQPLGARQGDGS